MQRVWAGLPAVAVAWVVCGCGHDGAAESRGVAGGSGAASGGSEQGVGGDSAGAASGGSEHGVGGHSGGAASGGSEQGVGGDTGGAASGGSEHGVGGDTGGAASGGSEQGVGGDSGAAASGGQDGGEGGGAPTRCQVVDGVLQYGPIGEPQPLPIELSSVQSAPSAAMVSGLGTAEGYGFVWRTSSDSNTPSWTLYGTTVDLDFGGGNPRVLDTKDSALSFDVIPASDGYLVATCSGDSEAEWIRLDSDFEIVQEASPITPAAPCEYRQPSILWTGKYYLTYFVDARGLVVVALDEEGDILREEILSEAQASVTKARFSKNGDRVLVASVRASGGLARYGVFDLEGRLMGDVQRFGEEESSPSQLAITTREEGWLVASDYAVTNETGVRLTHISKEGLVSREQQLWGGLQTSLGIVPSAYGGSLYVGTYYSGGAYGEDYSLVGLIDDAGSSAYYEEHGFTNAESWPLAVIHDSQRDLVVKASCLDDSYGMVFVQEYGCGEVK